MAIQLVIFDMDEVLYDYEHPKRLAYLARVTGLAENDIHSAIWDSGFEDAAEAGAYATGDEYLAAYGKRLGVALTRMQWIAARQAMMRPRPQVLALARNLAGDRQVALLTNNGMLLKEELQDIAPEAADIFGDNAFVSAEFGTKKPDPVIFERLLARLGTAPGDSLFIDDKQTNVEGAKKAGLAAHHFRSASQLRDALDRIL